ncbi:MAG: hypothetical protein ACWGNO_04575 [Desulfobacterales bacterium]
MTKKVVKLKPDSDMVLATCMNCHGTHWYVLIDRPGKEFTKITGLRCSNPDCGMMIKVT